ncbi:hypothetical protein F5Y17DRAFT_470131 [Xylariaceae sp. FL0594]|nr:hypothetical protein F5Y17DRAFT_470131 [Xylariaceae sp. FL0594]
MGQSVAGMIKFIDGADQSAQETREALDSLSELGKGRNDAAWAQATSNAIAVYEPISEVILRRQSIIASASTNTDASVTDILGSALNVVLGASSGQAQNMTAITSLISSIDVSKLKVNDLRAIVSMPFGSSSLEKQQQIYSVILAAYQEAVKVGATTTDGVLPPDAQERVKSLFVPSQYEASMLQRGVPLTAPPDEPPRLTPKIGRLDLKDALQKHRSSLVTKKLASLNTNDSHQAGAAAPAPAPGTDAQVDTDWINRFQRHDGLQRARPVVGLFDLSLRYCYETVLPTINTYKRLVKPYIANVALQYRHLSENDTGLVTVVSFKRNTVQNNSYADLLPEKAVLAGDVHHIVAPSQQDDSSQSPVVNQDQDQWVRYQAFERSDIIVESTLTVSDLPGGGYRVAGYTANDRMFTIDYSEEWQLVDR